MLDGEGDPVSPFSDYSDLLADSVTDPVDYATARLEALGGRAPGQRLDTKARTSPR